MSLLSSRLLFNPEKIPFFFYVNNCVCFHADVNNVDTRHQHQHHTTLSSFLLSNKHFSITISHIIIMIKSLFVFVVVRWFMLWWRQYLIFLYRIKFTVIDMCCFILRARSQEGREDLWSAYLTYTRGTLSDQTCHQSVPSPLPPSTNLYHIILRLVDRRNNG